MDFPVSPEIIEALRQRLTHPVLGYEAVPDDLLPAVTGWQRRRHQWQVSDGHLLRAPNVLNALATAVQLFTEPGDGVIVQPPVFFDFFDLLRENNREAVCNPLILKEGRYRLDFADLEVKAADPRNKLLLLCNPHNPIGRVWLQEELKTLGEICRRHNVLVVSDEIHGDIVLRGHSHTPFASLGPEFLANSITCLSPAKTFNIASCCCAFTVIADDERRAAFQAANSRLTVNKNNAFSNVAMLAAYHHGEVWLEKVLSYLSANVDLVRERIRTMDGVELIEPEGTFLLWMDFRELDMTADELTAFLRNKAGWVVSRGQAFGAEGIGFARVNIACPRARLETALDRLSGAIAAL
jgi:cystathionine beta-lyase